MSEPPAPPIEFTVADDEDGMRLDHLLRARFPGWSRRRIARALREGAVQVRGGAARKDAAPRKGAAVAAGARVHIERPPDVGEWLAPAPEPAPIEVLLSDQDVVAVCKPAGLPTHPLRAGERGTAANRVAALFPECARASDDPREGGAAHRLDTGTSGALLFARHAESYARLRESFRLGRADKRYLALVAGPARAGAIALPLGPAPGKPGRARPSPTGVRLVTEVEPVEAIGPFTLVRCHARTGARHQVRAHLAAAGWPVVGDAAYGGPEGPAGLVAFFLHAERVEVPHPGRSEPLVVEAPLPDDRLRALHRLRGGR